MATRAKARRKTKTKSRARPAKSASRRTATKRAATKRRAAPKRGASTKRRATTKRRTAPKSRAAAPRGRARMALVSTAKAMREKVARQPAPGDAIVLLEQDHREVEALYEQFERAQDSATKSALAWKICVALTVHARIEEEIFYPKARRSIDEQDLLDEAEVEHAAVKRLIAEIETMTPREKLYDAKVKVLVEYVKHHVKEEENELFPTVRESGVDLRALGEKLAKRKLELLGALSGRA